MLTLCNTSRGRVACGLGGVLIAVLALACLWVLSPSVSAGDDTPARATRGKDAAPPACPDIVGLPPVPAAGKAESLSPPPLAGEKKTAPSEDIPHPTKTVPAIPPAPTPAPPLPPVGSAAPPGPPIGPADSAPPLPATGPATPAAATVERTVATSPPQPAVEGQDIKQLVAQLSQVRADRAKLDEKERQTIQTIRRKYQEQKQALEQLQRELRQLGINCDDGAPDREPVREIVPSNSN